MPERKVREKRIFQSVITRAAGDDSEPQHIVGYAAIFESITELWPGYKEKIQKGAFTRALKNGADIRALINHNSDKILGRTKSGTLVVEEDEKGLNYDITMPNTTYAIDLIESVGRGDIDQSSYQFEVVKEKKDYLDDGVVLRTIIEAKLFDVSPVTFPAYEDTEAEVRAKVAFGEHWKEIKEGDKGFIGDGNIVTGTIDVSKRGEGGKEAEVNSDPEIHLANAERRQRLLEISIRL